MQITITGPRGCGKSTTAVEIAKFLRGRGCDVRMTGDGARATMRLGKAAQSEPRPEDMSRPVQVAILDGVVSVPVESMAMANLRALQKQIHDEIEERERASLSTA